MINRTNSMHRLDYHIVFSTKNRMELLTEKVWSQLRACFKEKANELKFLIHITNGMKDHVHILMSLSATMAVAEIVKHLKGFASRKIEEIFWQEGYAAYTIDATSFDRIFRYIENQKSHHEKTNYENELIDLRQGF